MYWFLAIFFLLTTPVISQESVQSEVRSFIEIHTDQLKEWYDQGKSMVVVDARSEEYFDHTLLPKAKWLPYDASEKKIRATIPSKNSLVVVYCKSIRCPASDQLAERLTSMGYRNVYVYPDGIQDWMDNGYPVTKK